MSPALTGRLLTPATPGKSWPVFFTDRFNGISHPFVKGLCIVPVLTPLKKCHPLELLGFSGPQLLVEGSFWQGDLARSC